MAKFEKHIFICTNQRPDGNPRGCCNPSGNAELHRVFKEKLRERGIPGDKVRANKSGCLEQCEVGPTVVVYPDAVWYGGVTPADVDEIIDSHIIGGQPVERLIIPDSVLNNTQKKARPSYAQAHKPDRVCKDTTRRRISEPAMQAHRRRRRYNAAPN